MIKTVFAAEVELSDMVMVTVRVTVTDTDVTVTFESRSDKVTNRVRASGGGQPASAASHVERGPRRASGSSRGPGAAAGSRYRD